MVEKEGRNITDIMVKNWHGEKKRELYFNCCEASLTAHTCMCVKDGKFKKNNEIYI